MIRIYKQVRKNRQTPSLLSKGCLDMSSKKKIFPSKTIDNVYKNMLYEYLNEFENKMEIRMRCLNVLKQGIRKPEFR
jgi:hypothetical protein